MWPRNFKMEEDNGGDPGNGAPNSEPPKKEEPNQQVELLTKAVGLLSQGMSELQAQNQKITETLEAVRKGSEPPQPKSKSLEEELAERGDDVETMTNKELLELMVGKLTEKFENRIKELSGEVETKVGGLAQQFHSRVSAEEVGKIAEKNPDLMEWSGEIRALLKDNPTLSVSRALTLAREENPQKKAELTKKYAKPPSEAKSKGFGLTPTSSRTTGTGKLSPKEAAEKAFDEVMSSLVIEDEKLG